MEIKIINTEQINFITLFNCPEKTIKLNLKTKVTEINKVDAEYLLLEIQTLGKDIIIYKGFIIISGDIYPTPKINNIMIIKELAYKFDDKLNLRIFVKAEISNEDRIYLSNKEEINTILDFTENKIENTLKCLLKINQNLYSNVFIVDNDYADNYYLVRSLTNNTIYKLAKKSNFINYILFKNDFIYICNYYNNTDDIVLTSISMLNKLSEENLFFLLEKNQKIKSTIFTGKIVEIPNIRKINNSNIIIVNFILLSDDRQLFEFEYKENKEEETNVDNYNKIKLGQLFLINDYKIKEAKDRLPLLEMKENAFIYFSEQSIYFSNKIKLNNLSVLNFHFLDYKENDNIYNRVSIKGEITHINKAEMYIIVYNVKIKYFEYAPIDIILIKNNNNKLKFAFNLMNGFMNKLNAFINHEFNCAYLYEYLYYSFSEIFLRTTKKIYLKTDNKSNKNEKIISVYDNYESSKRLRFNILNIPFQNEVDKKIINSTNSLLVCEVFKKGFFESKIVGIFNINEIYNNIQKLTSNDIFDNYYEDFGFIYDYFSESKNLNIDNIVDMCKNNYNKNKNTLADIDYGKISSFEEEISKRQFKTRIGLIVSSFLNSANIDSEDDMIDILNNTFSKINKHKQDLSYHQYLRLFSFLLRNNNITFKIKIFSKLNDYSPYLVAYKFNVEEINNITESSRLFMPYLEMDSYILTNYNITSQKSYSLSIEPLFVVRKHLLQGYEKFFLIEEADNTVFAKWITDEKITIINIRNIFKFSNISNLAEIEEITTPHILKNHAFAVSMEFRHENNSNQKNKGIISPIFYFDEDNIKKIEYIKNGRIQGEDGRLIEAFIDEDRDAILSLQGDIIYGDLLDFALFVQEDFSLLKEKMEKIKNSKNKFKDNINGNSNNNESKININKMNSNDKNINEIEDSDNDEKLVENLKRYGFVMLSDEEYKTSDILDIIRIAKLNNNYEDLPEFIKMFDKEMKRLKNKDINEK